MGRWRCTVVETDLQAGCAALQQAALHYGCGHWLIDARRRAYHSLCHDEWVTAHYLPQVQRALGEPLRVGLLVLPDHLVRLPLAARPGLLAGPVQFAHFVDEGAANAWLCAELLEGG